MLEELDAEFGVGELVQDEFKNDESLAYTNRDLRGLRVEHALVSKFAIKFIILIFFYLYTIFYLH
jgi:hypothetical protein